MNNGGDAAEQIVRLSLEGFEVAAKVTGEMAKDIAFLLISVLKQEQKTKGKARLTSMIKSGKELKVFSVSQKDLKKFTQEAKKYGVLYTVLRDKSNKNPNAEIDIIARAGLMILSHLHRVKIPMQFLMPYLQMMKNHRQMKLPNTIHLKRKFLSVQIQISFMMQ